MRIPVVVVHAATFLIVSCAAMPSDPPPQPPSPPAPPETPPPPPSPPPTEGATSVLFIGNSLTDVNDLPALVVQAANGAGLRLHVASVTVGNTAVIDHADGLTDARGVISSRRWDFVVLQQGPTPEGICRDTLVLGVTRLAPQIRQSGGAVVVFAPWTRSNVPGFLPEARRSAVLAAQAVNGRVALVGDAWRVAAERRPDVALHGSDGYHPALGGSWVAAMMLVDELFVPGAGWAPDPPPGLSRGASADLLAAVRLVAAAHDSLLGVVPPARIPPYPGPC